MADATSQFLQKLTRPHLFVRVRATHLPEGLNLPMVIQSTPDNSNLALTRTNFPFLSGHFLYKFTLDNLHSRKLEPFSISLEGSSYRESTVIMKLNTVSALVKIIMVLRKALINEIKLFLSFLARMLFLLSCQQIKPRVTENYSTNLI